MVSVLLRPIQTSDIESLVRWVNNPAVVGRFHGFHRQMTWAEEAAYVHRMTRSTSDSVYIVHAEDGTPIGHGGLHERTDTKARLAIMLGETAYWGKGYGRAAVRALVRKAFDEFRCDSIEAYVRADNSKMQHVLRSEGFLPEQVLPNHYELAGRRYDMIRFAAYSATEMAA